jgi:hypothetical protein
MRRGLVVNGCGSKQPRLFEKIAVNSYNPCRAILASQCE